MNDNSFHTYGLLYAGLGWDHPVCGSLDAVSETMSLERIPLAEPDLSGRESDYLMHCVETNWVSSAGSYVQKFEQQIAEVTGRRHAVAVVNGTAALQLGLVSAGICEGDHVAVPDFTFAATANAIYHAGAIPYFVDVKSNTWSIDAASLEAALNDPRYHIKAAVAVHTLGTPADMDPLVDLCRRAGIPLIEDAAGALGAHYKDRPVGALGDAALFSFNGNKTVTAGGGGMLVTDRDDWAERARTLSTQARAGTRYIYSDIGNNLRMTNVNAAIGVAQMERLNLMLAAKRRIAAAYDDALSCRADLLPMPRPNWADSACWLYSVLCASRLHAEDLVARCNVQKVEARLFWEGLSAQPPYSGAPKNLNGVSQSLSGRIVSLPCSSHLTADQQQRVIALLSEWRGAEFRDVA